MKAFFVFLVVLCGLFSSCSTTPPYDGPGPFEKAVNAGEEVQRSLVSAQKEGKHVLLVFGANWCSDSKRMVNLMQANSQIAELLRESYVVTRIDVGPKGSGRNADLVGRYHATIEKGIPVLVVLDRAGNLLNDTRQNRLKDSDHKHPDRILGFLRQHAPR